VGRKTWALREGTGRNRSGFGRGGDGKTMIALIQILKDKNYARQV